MNKTEKNSFPHAAFTLRVKRISACFPGGAWKSKQPFGMPTPLHLTPAEDDGSRRREMQVGGLGRGHLSQPLRISHYVKEVIFSAIGKFKIILNYKKKFKKYSYSFWHT